MGRDASIQNKLQFYHLSEEKFNLATYSATYFIYFAHKAIKNPKFLRILMVGTTGIEPVTPAMSMQCSPKIASQSAEPLSYSSY